MDSKNKFEKNAEEFHEDIKKIHNEMYEKLYASIPVLTSDPEYFSKANDYLNNLGIEGIIRLLGFDKVNEAILIWDGLHAMKYNTQTK